MLKDQVELSSVLENKTDMEMDPSDLILNPDFTEEVFEHYSSRIPRILSVAVRKCKENDKENSKENLETVHRRNCVAFSQLVERNSELLQYILPYFDANPAPFENLLEEETPPKRRKKESRKIKDKELLRASYILFSVNPEYFRYKWKFSGIFEFLSSDCEESKWYCLQILSLLFRVPVQKVEEILKSLLNKSFVPPKPSEIFKANFQDTSKERQAISCDTVKLQNSVSKSKAETLKDSSFLPNYLETFAKSGISARVKRTGREELQYVETKSSKRNLERLILGIDSKKPVFIEGPVGVGKTFIVEFLARKMDVELVKLQLSEETDVKGLLGYYKCTEIPGEFTWSPGILTEAFEKGCWLLLEDFSDASPEIKSLLLSLTSSHSLTSLFPHQNLQESENFRLFLTNRTSKETSNLNHYKKRFFTLKLNKFSKEELELLVVGRFKKLESITKKIVDLFLSFEGENQNSHGRGVSLRDLMKFCGRIEKNFNVSDPECAVAVLRDAVDLFCCWVPDAEKRLQLAIQTASILGLNFQNSEHYLTTYKPTVTDQKNHLKVGRAILRKNSDILKNYRQLSNFQNFQNFAFTKQMSCLLEKIAVSIEKKEAIVLVGETGTGKTSCVQFLAGKTGNKLTVLNMNQQSESSDLIGGFKPIDIKVLIAPIREEFEVLFRGYFAVEPNLKFLEHISSCFSKRNWKILVRLMSHSCEAAIKRLKKELEESLKNSELKKLKITEEKTEECEVEQKRRKLDVETEESRNLVSESPKSQNKSVEGTLSKRKVKIDTKSNKKRLKLDSSVEEVSEGSKSTAQSDLDSKLEGKVNKTGLRSKAGNLKSPPTTAEHLKSPPTSAEHLKNPPKTAKHLKNPPKTVEHLKSPLKSAAKFSESAEKSSESVRKSSESVRKSSESATKSQESAGKSSEIQKTRAQLQKWQNLNAKLQKFSSKLDSKLSLAFSFIEGSLINAIKTGSWILLDEINLASSETLECLSTILDSTSKSFTIFENNSRVKFHENFRIFAAMNPATDSGKKELPTGIRNRFSEFYFDDLNDFSDLELLVSRYLSTVAPSGNLVENIVKFYLKIKKEANDKLLDGIGHKPHFTLRTLCRALRVSSRNQVKNQIRNLERSIYEAFCLAFLTQLDQESYARVKILILGIFKAKKEADILKMPILLDKNEKEEDFLQIEGFWIKKGGEEAEAPQNYILTGTVKRNLKDLARVVSLSDIPVLLQGDTSVGKTSLITYLAKASGNKCLRINNHEHTDLQEYIGSYSADAEGRLEFREGVLVDAMRKGYWIILDELNLAPTDVLEALNRVLDDNRELFIPETQTTIKAHENFKLFATQNPPGLYAGRKVLSRAFRNRFIELHFTEIPANELEVILEKRCALPMSYSKELVQVHLELQLRRKSSATFAGKKGYITLRDLFRWAHRYAKLNAENPDSLHDYRQHLAEEGYLVLSSKLRSPEHHQELLTVLQKHLKREVIPRNLFQLSDNTSTLTKPILEKILSSKICQDPTSNLSHLVWTKTTIKNLVLILKSIEFQEPILLIGETGCGKTTICEFLAKFFDSKLYSINCHMNSESQDFIGGLRPSRNNEKKLFEWRDGPLLMAIKEGAVFLADEINMADDSVLERLNCLLESDRTLLVTEDYGGEGIKSVKANSGFVFMATMNPGGDFGKKELSAALRNRFTEIWCDSILEDEDLLQIAQHNLNRPPKTEVAKAMIEFLNFLRNSDFNKSIVVSTRDLLAWINFLNSCDEIDIANAFFHGACLCFLDGVGCGTSGSESLEKQREFLRKSKALLFKQCQSISQAALPESNVSPLQNGAKYEMNLKNEESLSLEGKQTNTVCNIERAEENYEDLLVDTEDLFGVQPFLLKKNKSSEKGDSGYEFDFNCETTLKNTRRILRALKLRKPILIEGSPGVGKTSLVAAIGRKAGFEVVRINLSDQTDISDLFGADLPVENGRAGEFSWKDGPLLRGLKKNSWILLDELNLASQSVLEGLNACFDHRETVFIPELNKSFKVNPQTRIFACQNPVREGGDRRGLPKSFLNRFTQVYMDSMQSADYFHIISKSFPTIPTETILSLINFNEEMKAHAGKTFAFSGSPYEFNLRDIFRFCELININYTELEAAELLYFARLRKEEDKVKAMQIYKDHFPKETEAPSSSLWIMEDRIKLGKIEFIRNSIKDGDFIGHDENTLKNDHLLLRSKLNNLRDLAACVKMNWLCILVGPSGSGKSQLVHTLSSLMGKKLHYLPVNPAMDTLEILGGFEQTDYNRHYKKYFEDLEELVLKVCRVKFERGEFRELKLICKYFEDVKGNSGGTVSRTSTAKEIESFLKKTEKLLAFSKTLKTLDTDFPLESLNIESNLVNLLKTVRDEKCLNAGGKFEWIESTLVKCVKDGGWVLLHQTNLATAALLDRLNCLLEPNGTLQIGERGVSLNGDIEVIKPHKDFRLFMAMDPKHGEISRAMRNRGVELFLSEISPEEPKTLLDIRALLSQSGLSNINYQNILLDVAEMDDKRNRNILDLIKVASLTKQRENFGIEDREAFTEAIMDVFEGIDVNFELDQLENLQLDLTSLSLPIGPLRRDFHHWRVRNEGFLLQLANRIRSCKIDFDLNRFFGFDLEIESVAPLLRRIFLEFCQRSSSADIEIRREYLKNSLNNDHQEEINYEKEIEKIHPTITNSNWDRNDNNLKSFVYFVLMVEEESEKLSKDYLSLYRYSEAVCKGKLSSQLKNQYLITNFYDIVTKLTESFHKLFRDESYRIQDEEYLNLMLNLKFLKEFKKIGDSKLVDKRNNTFVDFREVKSILEVYFKWIEKHLIRNFKNSQFLKFEKELREILENFSTRKDLKKLRKNFGRFLENSRKRISKNSMEISKSLLKLKRKIEISEEDFSDKQKLISKVNFLNDEKIFENRESLKKCFENLLFGGEGNFQNEGEVAIEVMEVENFENKMAENGKCRNLNLWPFYEIYFSIFVKYFLREFLTRNFGTGNENLDLEKQIFHTPIDFFEKVPNLPVEMISIMKFLGKSNSESEFRELISAELLIKMADFEENSFVINNSKFLCNFENEIRDEFENFDAGFRKEENLKNVSCTKLFLEFLRQKSKTNWQNFENFHETSREFESLRKLNFINSSALLENELNSFSNSKIIFKFYVGKFLNVVSKFDNGDFGRKFLEILKEFKEEEIDFENCSNSKMAKLWIQFGVLCFHLFSEIGSIDPIQKQNLKLKFLSEDIEELKANLKIFKIQNLILSEPESKIFKLQQEKLNILEESNATSRNVESGILRSASEFENFKESILSSRKTILSFENVENILSVISEMENWKSGEISKKKLETSRQKFEIWKKSLGRFSRNIRNNYISEFPDLALPILFSVSSLKFGISFAFEFLESDLLNLENESEIFSRFLTFPVLNKNQNYLEFLNVCFSEKLVEILKKDFENPKTLEIGKIALLKIALNEIKNYVIFGGILEKNLRDDLILILKELLGIWISQEEKKEKRLIDEQNLYRMKFSEEEEEEMDFKKSFPNYFEDFSEGNLNSHGLDSHNLGKNSNVENNSNLENDSKIQNKDGEYSDVITMEDAKEILEAISTILQVSKTPCENFVENLEKRFSITQNSNFGEEVYQNLNSSLTVLGSNFGRISKKKNYHFYRDPNVEEIENCREEFSNLKKRIAQLLNEWPENPILLEISEILARILSFDATSPLSRFLFGFEIMLQKIQIWEENAIAEVSLMSFLEYFGKKVIEFRKIEAQNWRESLESAETESRLQTSKWFFFTFNLLLEIFEKSDSNSDSNLENLRNSLEKFILGSPLIEFETRLNLILTFSKFIEKFYAENGRQLSSMLFNMFKYYSQYSEKVSAEIRILRAPIEKKLKEQIKIAKWTDSNFYYVKTNSEKTRRAIHKLIKEYKKQISTSISGLNFEFEETKKSRAFFELPALFEKKQGDAAPLELRAKNSNFKTQIEKFSKKSGKFSFEIISKSCLPKMATRIFDFFDESYKESVELRKIQPDESLSKEKRLKFEKSLVQRKKMALSNYFKSLSEIGVSHRIGLLKLKNSKTEIFNFSTEKLDFEDSKEFLGKDSNLEKFDEFYFKSLVTFEILEASFQNSTQKLGLDVSEKCRGFSAHLILLNHELKNEMATIFKKILPLEIQYANLKSLKKFSMSKMKNSKGNFAFETFDQPKFAIYFENFQNFISNLEIGLKQLKIFIDSVPTGDYNEILDLNFEKLKILDDNNRISKKFDAEFENLFAIIQKQKLSLESPLKNIQKLKSQNQKLVFHDVHFSTARNFLFEMEIVKKQLENIGQYFGNSKTKHQIVENIEFLVEMIEKNARTFEEISRSEEISKREGISKSEEILRSEEIKNSENLEKFETKLRNLIEIILLVIQRKYKSINEEEMTEENEEGLLTKKLLQNLKKEIRDLDLEKVNETFLDLVEIYYENFGEENENCLSLLLANLPLLSSYLELSEFYINQGLNLFNLLTKSVFLQNEVFLEISKKGFCQPKNQPENEERSKEKESDELCSFEDGKGSKDVSDRIEDEDQLEDAKRPEDFSKDEQKDKSDPENKENKDKEDKDAGIDVSENFDGELENPEDEDAEGDDDNLDNEDLENEFGETGKESEKLDNEMWSDDEENLENEDSGGQNGNSDKSEKIMSAKEKENNAADDMEGKNDEEKEEKEEKEEINEIDENNYDEDHIDPYHLGDQKEMIPEDLDLPDDLNLDGENEDEKNEDGEGKDSENPFEIDEMKSKIPEQPEKETEIPEKESEESQKPDSSDEEEESGDKEVKEVNRNLGEEEEQKEDEQKGNEDEDPSREANLNEEVKDLEEKEDGKDDEKENDAENEHSEQMDKELEENKADPSLNDPSNQKDNSDAVNSESKGSKDLVEESSGNDNEGSNEEVEDVDSSGMNNEENDKGTGQSAPDNAQGHKGEAQSRKSQKTEGENLDQQKENRKPGKSDENRSLAENFDRIPKKLQILENSDESEEKESEKNSKENSENEKKQGEMFEHSKNEEKFDEIGMDAATEDQLKSKIEEAPEDKEKSNLDPEVEEITIAEEEEKEEQEKSEEKSAEEFESSKSDSKSKKSKFDRKENSKESEDCEEIEILGENVETQRVERPNLTEFFTKLDTENSKGEEVEDDVNIEEKRVEIERELERRRENLRFAEENLQKSRNLWQKLNNLTVNSARDLSEKLRLVLEPLLKNRLKGDYKTGKRLNMRKIIPYIASDFRKDKIWLRRTKASKRNYQIIVAVDDSSSMADSHSQELAFESLSLISQALVFLEAGELSVLSFGQTIDVLHPLGECFNDDTGARLIDRMKFEQKKTMVGKLVDFSVDLFLNESKSAENSRLLVILSDGRGIFSEGMEKVNTAVRRAKLNNIFLVFIIVDNPVNKDSILDIRMPVFEEGKFLGIKNYMDNFPFPFYIILRDLENLPNVLSDALRQWFEIVGRIDT